MVDENEKSDSTDQSDTSTASEADSDEDLITQVNKERKSKLKDEPIRSIQSRQQKKRTPRIVELKSDDISFSDGMKTSRKTFGERLQTELRPQSYQIGKASSGNMEMTFKLDKKNKKNINSDNHRSSNTKKRKRRSASKNTFRGLG